MSIFSMFGGAKPQQQAPAAAPTPPGQTLQPQQQPTNQSSPLDTFKGIWENDPTKGNGQTADPFSSPIFNTDPSKITEAAGKADFMAQLPAELVQRAMSGNDPGAFMEVINKVAQNSLALSVQLSTAANEHTGKILGNRFKQATPGVVKDVQLSSMKSTNPVLQNPAAEPMLKMIRDRIRQSDPNASADDIQARAEEYLTTFASELSGSTRKSTEKDTKEQDWLSYAGLG